MNLPVYSPNTDAVLFAGTEVPDKEDLVAGDSRFTELNEWETYYLKFYGDVPEDFASKPFKRIPGNQFEINYGNFVGQSRILDIDIRVRSLKISEDAYEKMLYEIAERYASLVFSFETPVGAGYEKEETGEDHVYVEFLFLKHFLLDRSPDIDAVMGLILSNIHHRLEEEREVVRVDHARHLTPADVVATISNAGNYGRIHASHPLAATALAQALQRQTGRCLFLERVRQTRKYVTHDTPENRFVKFFLSRLVDSIERVHDQLPDSRGTFFNPTLHATAADLSQKLSHFLSASVWWEISELASVPESSSVLHGRSGYSDLFRLYSLLQLATRSRSVDHDFREIIETKNLPLLYEYWCLFLTIDALQEELGNPLEAREVTEMGNQEQLIPYGIAIRYPRALMLQFNLSCSPRGNADHTSYSHPFRPDIVVSRGARKMIFDAKAKGERGAFWGEESEGKIGKYKDDDIDKMHTYREAINNVFGAYILYPGTITKFFPCPGGRSEFEGVGAIALKPGESKSGVEHIRNAILAFLDH